MAFFYHLCLISLAVLMLLSQLDFASAAVRVYNIKGSNLASDNIFGNRPDPYVKVWCGSSYGGMTDFQQSTRNPEWVAEFNFPNCKVNDNLKLEVWDKTGHLMISWAHAPHMCKTDITVCLVL